MKNFWLKLSMRTKVIFFIFLIVMILSFIGLANPQTPVEQPQDNSEFIDRITNRNPILSYPVSYSAEWDGTIKLVPARVRELDYATSTTDQCGGITKGMDVYYTDKVDSIMIINNKNLLTTPSEISSFETAFNIINGTNDFDEFNAELQSFRTYCSYFSLYLVDEFQNEFLTTDYTRSILGIGLRQGTTINEVKGVGLFIYVYAAKDDYLIQISRSLEGSFLFSQANWDTCKSKPLQADQNSCLKTIYLEDPSMASKVESEINNLIKTFELSSGANF